MSGNDLRKTSLFRALLALAGAAGIIGFLAVANQSHKPPPPVEIRKPDPQGEACAEARKIVLAHLPRNAIVTFSDYLTDDGTGAAELGNGVWEAWGKIDVSGSPGAAARPDWHVAWDRKTRRVIYWKIGNDEHGNYAEALGASKAYSLGPDNTTD